MPKSAHDKILISIEDSNRNPIGVTYKDNLIILVQGINRVTMHLSMLSQLIEIRQKSNDSK